MVDLEVGGELLKFSVRVNGVLAGEVSVRHVVKPRLQQRYSVERCPSVVDGRRQSGRVLPRRLDDGRPPRPHRLDVRLQAAGEQRVGMGPQHRRH